MRYQGGNSMRKNSKLFSKSNLQRVISTVGVLALIAFSSVIVFNAMKKTITVNDNGKEQRVQTHVKTVEEVLEETGITVGKHDELSHALDAEIESGMTIDYKTAKQVTVNVDGEENIYHTTEETVEDLFIDHNLAISNHDDLSHKLDDTLKEGMTIDVTKAFQVTVVNGGEKEKYWTTGGTVEQLLNDHKITYLKNSNDKINVKLSDKIKEDTKIKIVRVDKEKEEVEEAIPFEVETQEDSSLEKGKEKVVSEGEEGLVVKTYEVTKEDGKKADRVLKAEKVKKESQNKVVAVGTKEAKQANDGGNLQTLAKSESKSESKSKPKSNSSSESNSSKKSNSSNSSGKTLTMSASAYTAKCSGCSGHTSTGINLNANPNKKVVAVDPSVIPLGTKVWVEGYGEAVAGDTGGNIVGNRIDLHFPNKEAALAFGQKTVTVKVLN